MAGLQDVYKYYARALGKPYEEIDIDSLANGYCNAKDTGNEELQNAYLSALILRYWYKVNDFAVALRGIAAYDREECVSLLYDCIENACEYRGWQVDTKLNADQCIKQSIATRGPAAVIYEYNRDIRKANVNNVSFDQPMSTHDDESDLLEDVVDNGEFSETNSHLSVQSLIQGYINRKKLVEAIILDTIAYEDTIKFTRTTKTYENTEGVTQKYVSHGQEFWGYKVVQYLSNLPDDFIETFSKKYDVVAEELSAVVGTIKKAPNQKLYKYLSKTLESVRAIFA